MLIEYREILSIKIFIGRVYHRANPRGTLVFVILGNFRIIKEGVCEKEYVGKRWERK